MNPLQKPIPKPPIQTARWAQANKIVGSQYFSFPPIGGLEPSGLVVFRRVKPAYPPRQIRIHTTGLQTNLAGCPGMLASRFQGQAQDRPETWRAPIQPEGLRLSTKLTVREFSPYKARKGEEKKVKENHPRTKLKQRRRCVGRVGFRLSQERVYERNPQGPQGAEAELSATFTANTQATPKANPYEVVSG